MISLTGILNGMSAMPSFENDIFISYAHIDNQPLIEGQKGWIDEFHHALETRLDQLLGEECKVWRDKKLAGNDIFDERIVNKLPKTALLVSILSPRYTKSEWCLMELKAFFTAAAQSGGDRIGEKSRVFKVIKTHVPREEHPPELQGLLGYPFYDVPTIQQHLYQQDFEVVLPAREGDEAQVQDDHKENLIWCDAAMIYYGNGNEPWFRTKVRDLDEAFGLGRQKNWLAKAVYLAPPKTGPKETLLSHEALVIPGFESFSPDSLEPFIAQLKKKP